MADAPDNETLNETSTPKTYLASVVCQVIRTRDLRDKGQIQLRWSANGRFFPPYLVPVDKLETCIADVRLAIQDIVTSLENAPEMLKSPGEIIDGVSLNTLIIELAKAGKSLYDRLLPKEDATQREIEKWLKMLAAEDRVDTVEIQIDDECADDLTKPLPTIPWNLLFDDKLIKPAELLARLNSGAVDDWGFFWGAKFDLSCGKNVNPFKADSPIDLETVTLVVMMDETILANLHQDTNTKVEFEDLLQRIDALRDPDSPAGKIVHLMHDMASLESFIEERNQTPDVLYWLSHAKPDSLFLEFLDGREGEEVTVDRLASTFAAAENPKRLVAFLNGCQTAEASIKGSFLNAFRKFDFCDGLIATERETLDVFAHRFGMEFLESFFIRQLPLGRILHNLRRSSLPLGLLYGTYCPPNIRIVRKSDMKAVKRSAPYRIAPELGASLRKLSAAALTTARETRLANATVKPPAPPQPWPDKPYPSLGFYTLKDQSLFLGRDDDSARLAELIDTPTTRILLLHGTSGSGKSSVIRAGLVPYLEANAVGYSFPRRPESAVMGESEELHLFFRPSDNFAARLAADLIAFTDPANPYRLEPRPDGTPQSPVYLRPILARCVAQQKSDVTLAELQAALDNPKRPELFREILDALTAAIPEKLVVTVDQAEELYTLGQGDTPKEIQRAEDRRKQAFALLRGCLRGSGRWKVILSYRTEYHGRITDGIRAGLRKTPGLVDYLITDLNKAQLRQVIERPTLDFPVIEGLEPPRQKYGFTYEPGVIDAIVDGIFRLRGRNTDSVLPIAQVVCTRLYDHARANAGKGQLATVRMADLDRLRHRRKLGQGIGADLIGNPDAPDFERLPRFYRDWLTRREQALAAATSKDASGEGPVLEILEDFAATTLEAVAKGDSQTVQDLKSLMMRLYLTQPDGTLTTAQMDKTQALQRFWSGSAATFDSALDHAAKSRLLRVETATGCQESEEATIRLGHDTLCKVAGRWDEAEQARRRVRKFQIGAIVAAAVCGVMGFLYVDADRAKSRALTAEKVANESAGKAKVAEKNALESAEVAFENQKKAEAEKTKAEAARQEAVAAAERAERFAANANLMLAKNLFDESNDLRASKQLAFIPANQRHFPWGLLNRQINSRDSFPLSGNADIACSVSNSADGLTLASGDAGGSICLWDVTTGKARMTLSGHDGPVWSVAFSPDGQTLASGSQDATIRLWDLSTGKVKATLLGHMSEVWCLVFSPDGQTLASGSLDKTIRLWNVTTEKVKLTLTGCELPVWSLAFSPNGQTLASGDGDPFHKGLDNNNVRLWDVATGKPKAKLSGHQGEVRSVVFSRDGQTLASGAEDKTVRLWNVSTGNPTMTLTGHLNAVRSVTFSWDGLSLATASTDDTVRLWDVTTGQSKLTLTGWHNEDVLSVLCLSDRQIVAFGQEESYGEGGRTIRLWDLSMGKAKSTLKGHKDKVSSMAISSDGQTLVSGATDKTVRLWDLATGKTMSTLKTHDYFGFKVASPDGQTLAALDGQTLSTFGVRPTFRLWDVANGKIKSSVKVPNDDNVSVVFSPDDQTLAMGHTNKSITLWDVSTGKERSTLTGHLEPVTSVNFSPDGRTLASGAYDKTVRIWDVSTGRVNSTLTGHKGTVNDVIYSQDGQTLASFSYSDFSIRLWDVSMGKAKSTLSGHRRGISSVAFSPDGQTLASGSADTTIRLWNVVTGKEKATLTGHQKEVLSVEFSPDGQTLASGSDDDTIRLWDVATGTEVRALKFETRKPRQPFGFVPANTARSSRFTRLAVAVGNDIEILDSEVNDSDTKRLKEERIARNFLRFYPLSDEAIAAIRRNGTLTPEEKDRIAGIIQPLIDFQKARAAANAIPLPENVFQP